VTRYTPHHLRHPARPPQIARAPGGCGQGKPSSCSGGFPVWFGAIVLGVFGLVSMLVNVLPYLTSLGD
jgi:hypothetical protein